jgi:type IX secretion system PorP/SprF family membrane protein
MWAKISKKIRPSGKITHSGMKCSMVHHPFVMLVLLLLGSTVETIAQDLHFSQAPLHATFQNPALTGVFDGDWRASGHYRSQWETVPVQYRTGSAATDLKSRAIGKNGLALGLLLAQDQAGDALLRWTQVGLQLSALHALDKTQVLSAGFGLQGIQRSFDASALKFNNQWDGDLFNPDLSSKEVLNNQSGIKASLSAGINWHFQDPINRTKVDAGIAGFHLNRPSLHFKSDLPSELPRRMGAYVQAYLQRNEWLDWFFFTQYQQMGSAREVLSGTGVRYWLDDETALQLTGASRWKDALIPALQVQFRQWTVGLSYDVNYSPFKVATRRRGGFEVAVVYTSLPVKPIKDLKVCPTF